MIQDAAYGWSGIAPMARSVILRALNAASNCCARSAPIRAPALEIERPGLPEDGHESRTWQLGAGTRDDKAFAEYGLRMAYHDLNDNAYGFPLGAQIEILQLKLRQYEGNRWQVQRLDLATIRSLTPRNELLQPWSWQVAGGLERVLGKHGDENLVSHVNGGARRHVEAWGRRAGLRHGNGASRAQQRFLRVDFPSRGVQHRCAVAQSTG